MKIQSGHGELLGQIIAIIILILLVGCACAWGLGIYLSHIIDNQYADLTICKVTSSENQKNLLSFYPGNTDFNLSTFYLGSTQAQVKEACEGIGGQLSGTDPNAEAGTPVPTCYFQNRANSGIGYYPVYWPNK